jgi:hypothetical protein
MSMTYKKTYIIVYNINKYIDSGCFTNWSRDDQPSSEGHEG